MSVMDVLRPALININGRIYRRNTVKEEHYEEEEDFSFIETPGMLSSVNNRRDKNQLCQQT